MISYSAVITCRHDADWQQSILLRRHRHAVRCVNVKDAMQILTAGVNRAVDDEACLVYRIIARTDRIAIYIDFYQIGRRYLVIA